VIRTPIVAFALVALALLLFGPASASGTSRHGGRLTIFREVRPCLPNNCPSGIQTVNGDGSGLRALRVNPPGSILPGALSPDGTRVAYTVLKGQTATIRLGSPTPTRSQSRLLTRFHPGAQPGVLVWSADSQRVAVATRWKIWVVDSAPGSSVRRIFSGKRPTISSVAWSPRGSRIPFVRLISTSTPSWALYVLRPDGTGLQRVASQRGLIDVGYGGAGFSWSPDDRRIIFAVHASRNFQKASIYSVDVGTRVSTRVGRGYGPLWAPRGERIAFVLPGQPGGWTSLWASRPDGTGRKLLAKKASLAAWSPDGTRIAAVMPWPKSAWLVGMQPNGNGKRAIVRLPYGALHVDWSR
jgi:Tol biopolymer transport system component